MLEQLRHRHEPSIVDAVKFTEDLRGRGLIPRRDIPSKIILLYAPAVMHGFRKLFHCERQPFFFGEMDFVTIPEGSRTKEIGIVHRLGIGGPAMALFVEKLMALGAREFLIVGTAGTLEADLAIGDFVLPFTALRDDGLSDHYLPKSQNVPASMEIVRRLKATFDDEKVKYAEKAVWTTDAFYRETKSAVAGAIKMGASVVDMEAAGLFAMCDYHRCKGAAVFIVSDHVGTDDWVPHFSDIGAQQLRGLELAVKALARA